MGRRPETRREGCQRRPGPGIVGIAPRAHLAILAATVDCVDDSDLIGWGLNLECVGECSQFAVSYPSGGLVVLKLVWMQLEADVPQSLAEREE